MDLNYLHHRRQASLVMAANAACEEARRIHRELADAYASGIAAGEKPQSIARPPTWNG